MGTQLPSPERGHSSPHFSARVYCGQTDRWIKVPLGIQVGLGPGRIVLDVLDGNPAPPKKKTVPNFRPCLLYQTARWIKMPLGTELGLGPGDIVLDEDPAPPKQGNSPHFSAHVYCGQTAGWIKMPLGTKVGFGPGHIVLDGNPPTQLLTHPPNRGGQSPQFSAHIYCGQTVAHLSYC